MVDVQKCRLEINHTFPDKEILVLRVAEEANLRGINFICARSDLREIKDCLLQEKNKEHRPQA